MAELIAFEGVTVSYDGVPVLEDFHLRVERGDKVVLQGRSGRGKSTLLELVLGFAEHQGGTVRFEGRPLTAELAWEVRKRVAYVSQELDVFQGKASAFMERAMGYRCNARCRPETEKLHAELAAWDLEPAILDKQMTDISGGERQRVALALAILLERDIFLLDEVTSGLDAAMKRRVIERFSGNPAWTVLAASHDREWENAPGVRVVRLEDADGRL